MRWSPNCPRTTSRWAAEAAAWVAWATWTCDIPRQRNIIPAQAGIHAFFATAKCRPRESGEAAAQEVAAKKPGFGRAFSRVRPAGRTHVEMKFLYTLGKEKCSPNGKGGVEA